MERGAHLHYLCIVMLHSFLLSLLYGGWEKFGMKHSRHGLSKIKMAFMDDRRHYSFIYLLYMSN
jgi:hypothetical protein